jgi:hypothetical protein
MSTYTHQSMTNHHGSGLLAQLGETIGLAWSDIVHEVEKPFWRA